MVVVAERVLDHLRGRPEARRGGRNLLRPRLGVAHVATAPVAGVRAMGDVCERRLQLGHGKERPLVDERPVVAACRRHEPGVCIQIRQLQTDGRRLEHRPLAVVEHRHPCQRMATTMRFVGLLRLRQHGQLIRRFDLSEHPAHAL